MNISSLLRECKKDINFGSWLYQLYSLNNSLFFFYITSCFLLLSNCGLLSRCIPLCLFSISTRLASEHAWRSYLWTSMILYQFRMQLCQVRYITFYTKQAAMIAYNKSFCDQFDLDFAETWIVTQKKGRYKLMYEYSIPINGRLMACLRISPSICWWNAYYRVTSWCNERTNNYPIIS